MGVRVSRVDHGDGLAELASADARDVYEVEGQDGGDHGDPHLVRGRGRGKG